VRALVADSLERPAERVAVMEAAESALRRPSADGWALGAVESGQMVGCVVHGFFAGADRVGRILAMAVAPAVRRQGIGRALLDAAMTQLASEGARFILAEIPTGAAEHVPYTRFLANAGFTQEGRIDGYFRAEAALAIMRRDL